eukprot:2783289-Rhodomonas_salina.2
MQQEGMQLQLPMSHYAPIEQWNIRWYFNVAFASAHTLADVGISSTVTAAVSAALTKAWAQLLPSALTWTQSTPPSSSDRRPFNNDSDNLAWAAKIDPGTKLSYDTLADIDALEPDPVTIQKAFKHPRLKPFWKLETNSEVDCLMEKGGLK